MVNKTIFSIIENDSKQSSSLTRSSHKNTVAQTRKTRFDKKHTMRFPVTVEQNRTFLILYKMYKNDFKSDSKTDFTTKLLSYGLRHKDIIQDYHYKYKDTKQYKTVKPNQVEYEMISGINGLQIKWGLTSERQALHRIMISVVNYMIKGGKISYEEIQPIRPSR